MKSQKMKWREVFKIEAHSKQHIPNHKPKNSYGIRDLILLELMQNRGSQNEGLHLPSISTIQKEM